MIGSTVLRVGSVAVSVLHILIVCMGGCLGCDINPKLTSSVDQLKGKERSFRKVEEPSISEDFWTNTTLDMDNSAFQSQGSISSISTSTLDASCSASGNGNTPSVFVNHGLLLWNQTRQQWVGNKESANQAHQLSEPKWSWNATYESMLGSNKRFDKPIPLPEMVDFLVDIWEQEGMYD